jgi:hypothetical protein
MSGQLVGEVLAASEELRKRGLSKRGFLALIAIAEKAHTETRQASVPWRHIQAALYSPMPTGGDVPSTAKRAVADLKAAGLVSVKRGFNNRQGRVVAPRYTIAPLTELVTQVTNSGQSGDLTEGSGSRPGSSDRIGHSGDQFAPNVDETYVPKPGAGNASTSDYSEMSARTTCGTSELVTQVTNSQERTGHSEDRTGHFGDRTGHSGDPLNGPINGSITKSALLRNRGTALGGAESSRELHAKADMCRRCPTCGAEPNAPCRRSDGEPRRIPCIARMRHDIAEEPKP